MAWVEGERSIGRNRMEFKGTGCSKRKKLRKVQVEIEWNLKDIVV